MNVNLLQDNPDWRWYILFGGLTLVFTAALWLITKCIPVGILAPYYVTARADIHSLASSAKYCSWETGCALAREKKQEEFKFFSMTPTSCLDSSIFGCLPKRWLIAIFVLFIDRLQPVLDSAYYFILYY